MAKLIVNPQAPGRKEVDLPQAALSIGRDPGNDVVIADALVSRRHAQIVYSGDGYILRDCNSANGSLVNGDRITERHLRDGDVVWLGASRLLFRGDDAPVEGNLAKVIQHPSAARLKCPACHNSFQPGDVFCRHCGVTLETDQSVSLCASCGSRVIGPARFCNACGDSLAPKASRSVAYNERLARAERADTSSLEAAGLVPRDAGDVALEGARLEHRALAGAIDGLFAAIIAAVFLTPAFLSAIASTSALANAGALVLAGLGFVAVASYFIAFVALRGATPGKELVGLAIVMKETDETPGFRVATVRFCGYILSALPLGLGFLMAAVDGETMHDRFAGTRVVRRS